MSKRSYDFSGWATRNDLKCSDGRTIRKNAFKDNDGEEVPLVYAHRHDSVFDVLGHALLENRDDGVYAYCSLNDTESGQAARKLVEHGDIKALSIYANKLQQRGGDVLHGVIKEVSLVLAGANPGARIESVMAHGEESEEDGIYFEYVADDSLSLQHGEISITVSGGEPMNKNNENDEPENVIQHAEEKKTSEPAPTKNSDDETVQDVIDSMTEKQRNVLYALVGMAVSDKENDEEDEDENQKGGKSMKHNLFDDASQMENKGSGQEVLTHDEFTAIMNEAKRSGSVRDAFIAHGIDQIDYLFPEDKNLNVPPEFISREIGWVAKVMNAVHHTPFSRIKSVFANLTEDDARAKGYIKGNQKANEVFGLLKRSTIPTTVYKKQMIDRDDAVDIADFDVVAWLKREMRMMLDEEIARAILIGDGRSAASPDKIDEGNIRPIAFDENLFTIKRAVTFPTNATDDQKGRAFIRTCVKARKAYRGTADPTLFTTQEMLTILRLLEDGIGHLLYKTDDEIAKALRVKDIVAVPVMDGVKGAQGGDLLGVIVNLADYNVGADKGGAVNMFDDFDIDFNQMKYLIETRCSGALTKPFSAIAIENAAGGTTPTYAVVTPTENANPMTSGWYELINGEDVATQDETVRTRKTYYETTI